MDLSEIEKFRDPIWRISQRSQTLAIPQFGASRYRIDLVATHPEKRGRPVLAIECDGASYHSCATARDRDRLRQAHLQRLGWRFHRIWSTDWFYNREQEIERAISAYEEAVRWAGLSDADVAPAQTTGGTQPVRQAQQQLVARQRRPRPLVPVREAIDHNTATANCGRLPSGSHPTVCCVLTRSSFVRSSTRYRSAG